MKTVKDYTDEAFARDMYAKMMPFERESWLADNPDFKSSDHSPLTVLQWREYAKIRSSRGTLEAQAYADEIVRAAFRRKTQAEYLMTRSGAVFLTLCGIMLRGFFIVGGSAAVAGVPGLIVGGCAFIIYATIILLGSIITGRAM